MSDLNKHIYTRIYQKHFFRLNSNQACSYFILAKAKWYKLTCSEYTLSRTNIKIYDRNSNDNPVYFITFDYFFPIDVVKAVLLYKKTKLKTNTFSLVLHN